MEWLAEAWAHITSYRPSDFLMFAPRTYWRQYELHNAAWWPWQGLSLALGMLAAAALAWPLRTSPAPSAPYARGPSPGVKPAASFDAAPRASTTPPAAWPPDVAAPKRGPRAALLVLAGAWALVAVSFHLGRYAAINSAAAWLAGAYVVQAVLLLALALRPPLMASPSPHAQPPVMALPAARARAVAIALGLWAWALCIHPSLPLLQGRPWQQAEIFGLAPDPTLIATLAALVLLHLRAEASGLTRWLLLASMALALALALLGSAALATMEEPQALVLALAALLAFWAWRGSENRRHAR